MHASSKEARETSEWCVCRRLQGEMSRAFNAGIEICSDCGPEHGRPVLDLTQGDCICARCGLVLCQKLIDESSETRNFADDLGQRKNERFSHAGHALGIVRAGGLATTVPSDGMPGRKVSRQPPGGEELV